MSAKDDFSMVNKEKATGQISGGHQDQVHIAEKIIGQISGGRQDQVHIAETMNITYDRKKDGLHALEAGAEGLLNKDYSFAQRELRVAVEEIDQKQHKKEAARARYLQALAMLGDDHPQDLGVGGMKAISTLLDGAANLDPCNAYLMTRAVIANPSIRRQSPIVITDYDKALFGYLKRCQSALYQQICRVFSL